MRNRLADIPTVTVTIAAILLMIVITPSADAKQRGDAGQSEGGTTGNYVFIAAGVCVIAGVTVYLVTKGKDDAKQEKDEKDSDKIIGESHDLQNQFLPNSEFSYIQEPPSRPKSEKRLPVNPFVGVSNDETITIGVSLSF